MNITQDIVDEILSRLPVKSLGRFRLVCKNWYSNIQSHIFIAKHIKNQATNEKLMIYPIGCYMHRPTVSICSGQEEEDEGEDEEGDHDDVYDPDRNDSRMQLPSDHLKYYGVEIIASCNGLVCFYYDSLCGSRLEYMCESKLECITLWNPATRDYKTLPPPPGPRKLRSGDIVGFGFDVAHNDYKVIRISQEEYPHTRLNKDIIQMKIYSLRSNSWRQFACSDLPTDIIANSRGTIFRKEKFCWLASSGKERMILSFDMGKEVFQKTQLPSDYVHLEGKNNFAELFQFHDSIALVQCELPGTENTCAIWSIKKLEQERSSWIKLAKLGPLSRVGRALGFLKCKNRNDCLYLIDGYSN